MIPVAFEKVWIENKVANHYKTQQILSKLGNIEINRFDDMNSLIRSSQTVFHPKDRSRTLVLSAIRGEILRKCPGTHGHLCCNYHIINQYIGCPIGCSYCILQGYLNQPFTIINVDIESIFQELEKFQRTYPGKQIRIGTGELGDSLVYDHLTHFSEDFLNFFAGRNEFIFEFKTKTTNVELLLQNKSSGNIVIGFSVNPDIVRINEEEFSASLKERIEAAATLVNAGYKIALHFDPIVLIPNAESEYRQTVHFIFSLLKPEDIAWISLGTFRYTTDLKSMMEYNYPKSSLLSREFVLCSDNKFRYFRPIRTKLYKMVIDFLHDVNKNLPIYLCMESPEVWIDTLGILPGSCSGCSQKETMDLLFKRRVIVKKGIEN
ncbi:MAG: radical SAM protein [Spirochaetales bacterium]|nr:radical SAM protein [Spirochaetales bacterium]